MAGVLYPKDITIKRHFYFMPRNPNNYFVHFSKQCASGNVVPEVGMCISTKQRKEEEDVVTQDKRYHPRMNPPGILNVYHLGAEKAFKWSQWHVSNEAGCIWKHTLSTGFIIFNFHHGSWAKWWVSSLLPANPSLCLTVSISISCLLKIKMHTKQLWSRKIDG